MTEDDRLADGLDTHDTVQVKLAEYQAAQQSAEHHERLGWQARNILWAASVTLFGFTLAPGLRDASMWLIGCLGIALLILSLLWDFLLGNMKRMKYARCRAIERSLGMKQHLCADKSYWGCHKVECGCVRPHKKKWLSIVLTILLTAIWGLRIATPYSIALKSAFGLSTTPASETATTSASPSAPAE